MKERKMKTIIIVFALLVYGAELRMVNEKCIQDFNTAEKEVLKNSIDSPYQLAIDFNTNTLFFSYTREYNGKSSFDSAYINLKTNEFQIIRGIEGGFANAVDQENDIVYLGGENGIYKFNYETNRAKVVVTSGKIWQIFFKKHLYYTTFPEEEVYIFKNGLSYRVSQLINTKGMLLALDNNDNIYFSNSSGLFVYKENDQKPTIAHVSDYNINGFTSDVNENLFFSTPNAIYSIDSNELVKQIFSLDESSIYGVAVENNGNIIYASEDSIVRLKPTKSLC